MGVEELSRIADYQDRNTCVLFGDGAGAAVLRPCEPGEGILSVSIHSDGGQGDILEVPAGGSRSPASAETVARREHFVRMRGRELFKLAVRGMEESLRAALAQAGLSPGDLELVIPHQANLRIIESRARAARPPAGAGGHEHRPLREHLGGVHPHLARRAGAGGPAEAGGRHRPHGASAAA